MSTSLRNAVRLSIATEPPATTPTPLCKESPAELYGRDVFGLRAMRQRLPKGVFARLEQAIEKGEGLHEGAADVVAPLHPLVPPHDRPYGGKT